MLAYTEKPHILCISETWLKEDDPTINIMGFTPIDRKDRQDRDREKGGGLLTFIRDDIKAEKKSLNMPQNSRLEAQLIEISLAHDKVSLLHIYNPEQNININDLDMLVRQLTRKFIIVGDFNGHHQLWDPEVPRANQCGRQLADYIIDHPDMALATTPGLITHTCSTPPFNTSTLDLTFCSNNLIQVTETFNKADRGSDHYPILTKVKLAPDTKTRQKRPKWKIIEEDISNWKSKLSPTNTTSDDINELETQFRKSLIEAAETTFKKTSGKIKTKYYKPWWNKECSKAVAERRRAKKRAERRPTIANTIDLRRCTAKAKKIIKRTKRETWRTFCNTLTAETPTKKVWDMVKKLNGIKTNTRIPINENGAPIFEDQRKAEILADSLDETLGIEPTQMNEEKLRTIQAAKNQQINEDMNTCFTITELEECIKSLETNKAAGDDEVINTFLKNLPEHKLTELLSLINKSWRNSELPINWKNALIIPISKPGKDLSDPTSYRPISLLSCVGKVAEKMVNTRLTWFLEKEQKYSETQFGFRPGRTTEDLLVKIEHKIRSTLVNRKVSVAVFFDLKSAFDTINHEHILYKLANAGITGNMLRWIEAFLQERTYQVIVGNSKSEKRSVKRGVPQGSCLSPTLFNIIMSDIPHSILYETGEYADDIAIITTGDSIEEVCETTQAAINTLETWAGNWNLNFNSTKTKSMCFTKKKVKERLEDPELKLKINQEEIEWVKTCKYLGATLDAPTLTWEKHYEELAREGLQRVNIMRAISGTSWGANRELLISFYKSYIRSKITYGAAATTSACQTRQDILERIQNAALRVAIGARKTSPVIAMQVDANLIPLKEHLNILCLQYYHRKKSQENQSPFIIQLEDDPDTTDKVWTPGCFKKPLVRRVEDISRNLRTPLNLPVRTTKVSSDPPWKPPKLTLRPDIPNINKNDSREQKRATTLDTINTEYSDHIHLYTDGSKNLNSTSAGLWIPDFQHRENWKLNHGSSRSIMGAELYAIDKAMTWILLHKELLTTDKTVILTDSRSGIEALKAKQAKRQSHLLDSIKQKAQLLADANMDVTIQYLPGHVGIEGNEQADSVARMAHNNQQVIYTPLDTSETKKMLENAQLQRWTEFYEAKKPELHIGPIKTTIGKWPWARSESRKVEVAMTRLRIGHVGLNNHLKRFNIVDSELCSTCRVPETVPHFLTECRKYIWSRRKLLTKLARINVHQPDYTTLLGGGPYPEETQLKISRLVAGYLTETGTLGSL